MRLIDVDALKKEVSKKKVVGRFNTLLLIDNAPTVTENGLIAKDYIQEKMFFVKREYDNQPIAVIAVNDLVAFERPQGEWIPISERLPNKLGVYNVTRKLKEGETVYFISGASYFDGQNTWHRDICVNHGKPYLTDIIAWQPLPEPYKKGGKE